MITDITTYQQLVKQHIAEQAGTTDWSNYLKGLKTPYEAKAVITQQRTAYDISDAYAKYKQSQLNLLRNRNLSESLKNQLSESSRASYQSAYGQYRTQELESLQGIQSDYQTQVAAVEKAANEQAKSNQKIMNALYDFAGAKEDRLKQSRESGGLEYYRTENGETYLTPYGQAELGSLLFRGKDITDDAGQVTGKQLFTEYLRETDYDTYEKFQEDPDTIYRMLGFEPGTRDFTKEESEMMIAAEDVEQEAINKYGLSRSDKDFTSSQEKKEYYEKAIDDHLYKTRNIESNVETLKNKYCSSDTALGGINTDASEKSRIFAEDLNKILRQDAVSEKQVAGDSTSKSNDRTVVIVDINKLTAEEKEILMPFLTQSGGEWRLYVHGNTKSKDSHDYSDVIRALSLVSNKEKERQKELKEETKQIIKKGLSDMTKVLSLFSKKEK